MINLQVNPGVVDCNGNADRQLNDIIAKHFTL